MMSFDPNRLKVLFEEGRDLGLHSGLQLHVRHRGRVLLDVAWGEACSGVPLENRTLMLWMSSGKPLLAAGLGLMFDERKLDWDDWVVRFIPEFGKHGKEGMTLRHLLTHTGGFRGADLVRETDWGTLVAKVCDAKLEPGWEPGKKAGYHSSGSWVILGEVVRRITGSIPGPWLRENLFLPWGLCSTSLGLARGSDLPVSCMHLGQGGDLLPHPVWSVEEHLEAGWPGSNILSTAHDMAVFYEALLDGGRGVLRRETVAELVRPQREGMMDHTFKHRVRMGLGFILDSKTENISWHSYGYGRYASHATFGHGGNQSSLAFADPAHGLVVAAAYNAMPGELPHQGRVRQLVETVYLEAGLG